jgi:hypothetical protein
MARIKAKRAEQPPVGKPTTARELLTSMGYPASAN